MKNLAIARRYAKALILIGQQEGQTESYRNELQSVAATLAGSSQLEQAITNPLYDSSVRQRVLQTLIKKMSLSQVVGAFLVLLLEKGRFGFLGPITDFYQKMADELRGVERATVVSATELPDDTVERIRQALCSRTGKDVVLDFQKDPGLIGGIITKIGDLVLDGSVRTQLLSMRESLKRGEGA
jgi:F-type H+-transporting ATPase subunit delta